jgi:hypothetical protein
MKSFENFLKESRNYSDEVKRFRAILKEQGIASTTQETMTGTVIILELKDGIQAVIAFDRFDTPRGEKVAKDTGIS